VSLVLDCSVTLSWYFEDEQTPVSRAILQRVVERDAVVPPLWRYEVANGLQTAVRRRRVSADFRDETLADLADLDIVPDADSDGQVWAATVRLAERHGLSVYDAAYLELAQRRRLELATFDGTLARAARAENVVVLGS
jgi:predicted nucleic acid-binding protein